MTEAECEAAYRRIEEILEAHQLTWVVNEVETEVRLGRTLTKRVASRVETPEEVAVPELFETPRRTRVRVSATRPYTAQEKLRMIIDAVQHAVVETLAMEQAIRDSINNRTKIWQSIQLVRIDDRARTPIDLPMEANPIRVKSVQDLTHLLTTLRRTV